jgi:hypothetical protein
VQRFHDPTDFSILALTVLRPTQRFGSIFQREFLKSLLPADISVAASGIRITLWYERAGEVALLNMDFCEGLAFHVM